MARREAAPLHPEQEIGELQARADPSERPVRDALRQELLHPDA